MDLHPILNYSIKHLSWETDTHPRSSPYSWDLPVRGTFVPASLHLANVYWQDANLGFLSPAKMEAQFRGRDLILRNIQYIATLACDGKLWQQRFSHEFLGEAAMATRLTRDSSRIQCSGIMFEEFDASEVFDGVTGAAKHVLVMQFVS